MAIQNKLISRIRRNCLEIHFKKQSNNIKVKIMKAIITTIISISLLLTYGCSTEKHDDEQSQSEVAHATDADAAPSVQLDNGNKWIANMETTQGIEAMIRVVEEESTESERTAAKRKITS
jgi:hypothetical protein